MIREYEKAVHAEYPDLPEAKIESAVSRFNDLIMKRFRELNRTAITGSKGHA